MHLTDYWWRGRRVRSQRSPPHRWAITRCSKDRRPSNSGEGFNRAHRSCHCRAALARWDVVDAAMKNRTVGDIKEMTLVALGVVGILISNRQRVGEQQ